MFMKQMNHKSTRKQFVELKKQTEKKKKKKGKFSLDIDIFMTLFAEN